MRLLPLAAIVALSCGGGSLKRAGETCTASSECGAGLICDDGKTPHVCAGQGSVDAFVPELDAPATHTDATAAIDGATLPDAHVTPDAAAPDAAVMIDAAIDAAPTPDAAVVTDAATD